MEKHTAFNPFDPQLGKATKEQNLQAARTPGHGGVGGVAATGHTPGDSSPSPTLDAAVQGSLAIVNLLGHSGELRSPESQRKSQKK